jgi:hypothetical protein
VGYVDAESGIFVYTSVRLLLAFWSGHRLIVNDDQLADLSLANTEVEGQDQRIWKPSLIVGPINAGMHRDAAFSIQRALDCHRERGAENFLFCKSPDRFCPGKLALDVIDKSVLCKRGHPGVNVMIVTSVDMVDDYGRQVSRDVIRHSDPLQVASSPKLRCLPVRFCQE